jgi:hypothetical protein
LPAKGRRRRAEEAAELPAQVRLVEKPARRGDLGHGHRLISLRHKLARVAQAHPQQILMRRFTGGLPKFRSEMTPAQLRQIRKLS